jgi:hypothetical protein
MTIVYGLTEETQFSGILGIDLALGIKEDFSEILNIAQIVKRKKVVLEQNPTQPLSDIVIDEEHRITLKTPQIYQELYERLNADNNVVFLEDDNSYKPFADEMKLAFSTSLSPSQRYRHNILGNHFYFCTRDARLKQKIRSENPDIAFIGGAHAYNLHLEGHRPVFMDIPVNADEVTTALNRFMEDMTSPEDEKEFLDALTIEHEVLPTDQIPPHFLASLDADRDILKGIKRTYNCLTNGRIEGSKTPDFVGTWNLRDIPAQGYFELYITKNVNGRIQGTILDFLGDSEFEGTLKNGTLRFEKTYTKPFKGLEASTRPIAYSGLKTDNGYSGLFFMGTATYNFVVFPYSKAATHKILHAETPDEVLR